MTPARIWQLMLLILLLPSCKKSGDVEVSYPQETSFGQMGLSLDARDYRDKVLGAIVGSAIGDALGAPTEMWHRSDIQNEYGYITDFTPAIRVKSPEGTWRNNMDRGATTDDTRWKYLVVKYMSQNHGQLTGERFAQFIAGYYQDLTDNLSTDRVKQSTDALDEEMDQVLWIKEWARVSLAFIESDDVYHKALNRFYGGEMSCAGMLYTPVFGLRSPTAQSAYQLAYDHAIFDLGYARDISAVVASMTRLALDAQNFKSVIDAVILIDPYHYQDARLVGRLSAKIAFESKSIVDRANDLVASENEPLVQPDGYPGQETDWVRQNQIYAELEKRQKSIAFHAGEIWQILYTGLVFGQGDFEKTMLFIVNYGRDNDTVAAVAGMILGAYVGYDKLPGKWKQEIVEVSQKVMGIDLVQLADDLVPIN